MHVRLVITIAATAAISACTGTGPSMQPYSQAGLPAAVQVPAGHTVTMQTMAAGELTWQCRAKADMAGQFEWVFAGPDAGLKDRNGAMVGKYYGPPATWESVDGSRLTGTQLAIAPAGDGNIPLQLVKANPAMGMGVMQGVSHVQRVNTRGGVAPAASCSAANQGEKRLVRYSADYVFWRAAM
jgi:Protein of unknown function (DUF3455)